MRTTTLPGQGWRFLTAHRALARHPISLDEAKRAIAEQRSRRDPRFVEGLDELVWPFPSSPARRLLECCGAERGDVWALVEERGLDAALAELRDRGVYVSYEEARGTADARRGSATLHFEPDDFANPRQVSDHAVRTSGTRSGGTPAMSNLDHVRRQAVARVVHFANWGVLGARTALWIPAFPGGGIRGVLYNAAAGNRLERWFSQVELSLPGVAARKRLANRALAIAGSVSGTGLPRPTFVPPTRPGPVLEWARQALDADGRAFLSAYASSAARMALEATERGVRLDGLVVQLASEPVTAAKVAAVEATGARATSLYGFVPDGIVGVACPPRPPDQFHLWEHDYAVVTRRRPRPDGVDVAAFCWTTLAPDAPRVLVNVENDDYGEVASEPEPCTCLLGELGLATSIRDVRGMTKVVAGGTTVPGEAFEELTDAVLPRRFGGGPTDWQFVEEERGGPTALVLRVDPRLGPLDDRAVVGAVHEVLGRTEAGLMASRVLAASLRVVRASPVPARSGKVLPFESLAAQGHEFRHREGRP